MKKIENKESFEVGRKTYQVLDGEIWLVDLNPIRGHEQAGTRRFEGRST